MKPLESLRRSACPPPLGCLEQGNSQEANEELEMDCSAIAGAAKCACLGEEALQAISDLPGATLYNV